MSGIESRFGAGHRRGREKTVEEQKVSLTTRLNTDFLLSKDMGPLPNERHEKFAQLVGTGMNATEAYRTLYGKDGNVAQVGGCKLKAKLLDRISEIANQFSLRLEKKNIECEEKGLLPVFLTKERSLSLLSAIAMTPVGHITDASPLCQAVKYKTVPGNRNRQAYETIEYRMPDKIRAIELHAKLMGWLEAEGKQTVNVSVAVVTEEKRKTIMERRRAALEIKAE